VTFENLASPANPKRNGIPVFPKPPSCCHSVPVLFLKNFAQTSEFGTQFLPDFRKGDLAIEAWFQERQDDSCGVIFIRVRAGFDRIDMSLVDKWPVPHKVGSVVPESNPQVVLPMPDTALGFGFELREPF